MFVYSERIIGKFNNISQSVKASIAFVICSVLTKGISFFTLPLFTRLLTTEEYGYLTIYNSWFTIITIFASLTVWGGYFNTGYVMYEGKKAGYSSAVQSLGFIISFIYLLLGILFSGKLGAYMGMPSFLVICMFIEVISDIPYNIWMAEQRFEYKYKSVVLLTLILCIINPLLSYLFIINNDEHRVESRIVAVLLIKLSIGFFFYIYNWCRGALFYVKKIWIDMLKKNGALIPHYLSIQILSTSDRIMIGKMCGEDDAAIYGVAYTFAMLISLVCSGVESSFVPYVYRAIKKNDTKEIKKKTTAVVILICVCCLALICVIPDIFKYMLPESYYGSLMAIPPIAVGAFFLFLYPIFSCIEFYYGETRYVSVTSVALALLNVIMNYYSIHRWGFVAAAYTTMICYFIMSVVHAFLMKMILHRENGPIDIYNIRQIVFVSFAFLLLAGIIMMLYSLNFFRYLLIVIILAFFIIKRESVAQLILAIVKD